MKRCLSQIMTGMDYIGIGFIGVGLIVMLVGHMVIIEERPPYKSHEVFYFLMAGGLLVFLVGIPMIVLSEMIDKYVLRRLR